MSAKSQDDPTLDLFARFARPELWYIKRNVPIFCAHERKGKDGKVLYTVGDKEMESVCQHYRKLEKEDGVVPRIAIGHMSNDGEEKDQPEPLGFARNLHTGTFGPGQKKGVLADFWIYKGKEKEAGSYPYRSVEFYPSRMEIAGISLLRRDPQLDLGIVLYQHTDPVVRHLYLDHKAGDARAWPALCSRLASRQDPLTARFDNDWLVREDAGRGSLVCYQRETQDMAEEKDDPTKAPKAKTPEKAEKMGADEDGEVNVEVDVDDDEADEEFRRHIYSHPGAAKHYERQCAKYAAAGGLNTGMPDAGGGMPGGPPMPPPEDKAMMRRDAEKYSRMEKRVKQLEQNLVETTLKRVEESRRNDLQRLRREEGILLDVEEELIDCIPMTNEQYARQLKKYQNYERDPAVGGSMIRLAENVEGGPTGLAERTRRMEKAMEYQREHPGTDWEEAWNKCAS